MPSKTPSGIGISADLQCTYSAHSEVHSSCDWVIEGGRIGWSCEDVHANPAWCGDGEGQSAGAIGGTMLLHGMYFTGGVQYVVVEKLNTRKKVDRPPEILNGTPISQSQHS